MTRTANEKYTRSGLFSLLTEACELEHGLACSYLYSAFTLKKDLREGGLSPEQLWRNRKWAGDIFLVAAQEMLHLSQVWNILAAIGGNPYYLRPNFPQPARYYPLSVPLRLEPFGEDALLRFVRYERPADVDPNICPARELDGKCAAGKSVGELYAEIADHISAIDEDELFVGRNERQVDESLVDFPHIVQVTDRKSALRAIDMITEQGEGSRGDREDSHYATFVNILDEHRKLSAGDPMYDPARKSVVNPATRVSPDVNADEVTLILADTTKNVAEIFDDCYELMMKMLSYVFVHTGQSSKTIPQFADISISLMTAVVKPLGELLTKMPLTEDTAVLAGPTFRLSRHVSLPPNPCTAKRIAAERLSEITENLSEIGFSEHEKSSDKATIVENLKELADRLRN